ncbi:MAG: RNA polymerase factor sigma-54 [Bacteroidetes bacterium]|nr:RNA polymerase factor sigma-54 [Bacteroidota bacterium]MCL5025066.1 RNA polymerase factor sigma-54 [Chloroflexota bacterium]
MEFIHELTPEMGMRVSPRLVAANQILEMSSQELQQVVASELADNPALELVETPRCPRCGEPLEGTVCPRCEQGTAAPPPEPEPAEISERREDESDFDPLNAVAAEVTLGERLLEELETMLPEDDHLIAEYLVGSLDDNGYLQCSVEDAAAYLDVPKERVEEVLRQLQSLEPAGIGARNLRESLLIQIDRLAEEGTQAPYTRQIVSNYLRELADHRYGVIASQLGIPYDDVSAAVQFIRHHLNPYPAQGYTGTHRREAAAVPLVPDVVIRQVDSSFEVEVVESRRFTLRISPAYQTLSAELERDSERYSEEEREHIRHYLGRARFFLTNINQRRQTIQRIADRLVDEQHEFLEKGAQYIKPLTRAALAQQLGIHESTVSRAIAAKYVLLPKGHVVPLSQFFTASLGVRELITQIVAGEEQPLSDQDIVERLAAHGVKVARRTVAKYRSQLNILPSSLRSPRGRD